MNRISRETMKRFLVFGGVGVIGTIINTLILWSLTSRGMFYILAAVIATEVAIVSNFIGNHLLTFRDLKDSTSLASKFGKFQTISMFTIIGTVILLWTLTSSFGEDLLLVWNLIAIAIMFIVNFILNRKFTWNEKRIKSVFMILFFVFFMSVVSAGRISLYQERYYPDFEVSCQRGNTCSIVGFSSAKTGECYLKTNAGTESPEFIIGKNLYSSRLGLFEEFFDALSLQNSDYQEDINSYNKLPARTNETSLIVELSAHPDKVYKNAKKHEKLLLQKDLQEPLDILNATLIVESTPNSLVQINEQVYGETPRTIKLEPGTYNITLSSANYVSNSTLLTLGPNEAYEHLVTLEEILIEEPLNSTLSITTDPVGAEVLIDEEIFGITPLEILLGEGSYEISVRLDGYITNTTNIWIGSNETYELHFVLQPEESNETGPQNNITGQTNLSEIDNSLNEADYWLYETETAYFYVHSNYSVEWKVNGEVVMTTLNSSEFIWTPGILYSGADKFTYAEVSATSGESNLVWKIDVRDVINPFFEPSSGDGQTTLNIFTYDLENTYENVSVTITNPSLSSNTTFNLEPTSASNNETDWSKPIIFTEPYTHHIVKIKLDSREYNFQTNKLGYYKTPPVTPPTSRGGTSKGGRSAEKIELVYVVLDKSYLTINDSLEIKLDAKNNRRITDVEAIFLEPSGGLYSRSLDLVNGTNYYGTWKYTLKDFTETGLYELYEINITGDSVESFKNNSRAFYVINYSASDSEELGLVYTSLNESEVSEVKNVTLTIDARDVLGIDYIEAYFSVTRSGEELYNFTIPLRLIQGDSNYGTWEGRIPIEEGDATYELKSIILSNSEKENEISIEDRSVYATSDIPVSILTGAAIGDTSLGLIKNPLFPLAVALLILTFLAVFFFINGRRIKIRDSD